MIKTFLRVLTVEQFSNSQINLASYLLIHCTTNYGIYMVKTDFVPSRDGFHFPNHFTNNIQIIGGLSITTSGRCGGMAFGALDYFTRGIPVPTCNGADFGEAQAPSDGTPLADYIYKRLMDSLIKYGATYIYKHFESDHETLLAGKGLVKETKEDEWPVLKSYLDNGRPVVLGLIAYNGGLADCHQVVAYGYTVANGIIKISIYDNNLPDDDTVTLESTVDLTANLHWNEVNSSGQVRTQSGKDIIWRGFFVEADCEKSPSLTMPLDLLIAQGINTNATRVCLGDSLTCTFVVKNFGTYKAHLRFPHVLFDKVADPSVAHPAQPVEQPYDGSSTIDLAPNQQITITKTFPNMGPLGQYRIKGRFVPGTKATSSVNLLPNIYAGAKPLTQIEVINKVAIIIEVNSQKQHVLYEMAPSPVPRARTALTATAKTSLSKVAASKVVASNIVKELDILGKIGNLKDQIKISGGAYTLGVKAFVNSQFKAPVTYTWKAGSATPQEQTLVGNPVELTLQVGKTGGPFTYDHKVEITATDATGASTKDTFTLKLPSLNGKVSANYDDTRNVVGKTDGLPQIKTTTAYTKLVIATETQGAFGQCTYTWQPLTAPNGTQIAPQILDDGSKALYTWPLTGNASSFDSYQSQTIKVTVKDQIGQTTVLQATVANPLTRNENPVDQGSVPVLQAEFDDPRTWVTINDQITNPANTKITSVQLSKDTTMTIQNAPTIQITRLTYGQKTATRTKR